METDLVYEILCLRKLKMMDTVQNNGHIYCNIPSSKHLDLADEW
jgi:hypothetical protein